MKSLLIITIATSLLVSASSEQEYFKAGTKVVEQLIRKYETPESLCTSSSTRYQRFCNGEGGSQCEATGLILCTGIGKGISISCSDDSPFCDGTSFGPGFATCTSSRPYSCSPAASEFVCLAEGIFPDPTNCQNYINCVSSGNDTFTSDLYDCGSLHVFDPSAPKGLHCRLQDIENPSCVKVDCSRNPLRNVPMTYPNFPVCKGEIVATCLGDKMPLVTRCPAGFKANLALLPPICEVDCSEIGNFEYPGEANMFYQCMLTSTGWKSVARNCFQGYFYDKVAKACVSPVEPTTTSPPEETSVPTEPTTSLETEATTQTFVETTETFPWFQFP